MNEVYKIGDKIVNTDDIVFKDRKVVRKGTEGKIIDLCGELVKITFDEVEGVVIVLRNNISYKS